MTILEARINVGRRVTCKPAGGGPAEEGVTTAVGVRYVHVRYDGDAHAKATDPARPDAADCGASFRGYPPTCPECGMELWWDGEDEEDDELAAYLAKALEVAAQDQERDYGDPPGESCGYVHRLVKAIEAALKPHQPGRNRLSGALCSVHENHRFFSITQREADDVAACPDCPATVYTSCDGRARLRRVWPDVLPHLRRVRPSLPRSSDPGLADPPGGRLLLRAV